ncbi:MAG: DNA adenine methylase [Myxococcota bacterium]
MNAARNTQKLDAPKRAKPFLKWAGGKTKLVPEILKRFPNRFTHYHEPFVGGAAVFFSLEPQKATLSDINDELVNAYRAIRDDVDGVVSALREHTATEEHFYEVRGQERATLNATRSTARTIFLNRTCFNGLYRVNRKGQFNVPFGRYANPKICDEQNLNAVSQALQGVSIEHRSAFEVLDHAKRGDLVYFDPPYDPVSKTASFTSYTKSGFGDAEQEKLADVFAALDRKGVHVVLSNSDTEFIRSLYQGFQIDQVFCRRAINSRADRRGPVAEVLVSNRTS